MDLVPILASTSHAPFYIAGALLAVWAVILSAIGLSRPDFPSDNGATRGAIGITVLLVLATLGTAIGTASTPSAEEEAIKEAAAVPEQVGVAPPVTPPAAGGGGAAGGGSGAAGGGAAGSGATAAAGKAIFIGEGGCGACHTYAPAASTGQVGPNLDAVGKGDSAALIKESIVAPNKVPVKGFAAGIMPQDYGTRFTPEQIDALVAFLKSTAK